MVANAPIVVEALPHDGIFPSEAEAHMSENRALVTVESKNDFMPVLSVEQALQRRNSIKEYTAAILKDGTDYGVIPGTEKSGKPKMTLLKPGAEKLCTVFGLAPRFDIITRIEDWTGNEHGGEPFFYYLVKCKLYRGDRILAEGDGSCNSWESRYRYRNAKRTCPRCGKASIIKGKEEYGGGWTCFKKIDGCGAKFPDGDQEIEGQPVGKVKNIDVADIVNTVLKMAEKRALISATLIATNASDSFTQDMEDAGVVDAEYVVQPPRQSQPPTRTNGQPPKQEKPKFSEALLAEIEGKWVRARYCKPGFLATEIREWATGQNCDLPISQWPKALHDTVGDFLRGLLDQVKQPAPRQMLDTIEKLKEELGWSEQYAEDFLTKANLLQRGEIPNEHQAQSVILCLQEELRKQTKETVPPSREPGQDDEEYPF